MATGQGYIFFLKLLEKGGAGFIVRTMVQIILDFGGQTNSGQLFRLPANAGTERREKAMMKSFRYNVIREWFVYTMQNYSNKGR